MVIAPYHDGKLVEGQTTEGVSDEDEDDDHEVDEDALVQKDIVGVEVQCGHASQQVLQLVDVE